MLTLISWNSCASPKYCYLMVYFYLAVAQFFFALSVLN